MIPVRFGLQQRILPSYRVPFFDSLASVCPQGMGLFAGKPRPIEVIDESAIPQKAFFTVANNIHIFKGKFYLCWQKGFINWLESWQPEVLIVEANPRYLSTPLAIRWMKRQKRSVIAWGLGSPKTSGVANILRIPWQKSFFRQFNALIAYSQQGAEEYKKLGVPVERIFVAANAVTSRPTQPCPKRSPDFFRQKPTLLFVGRLQERKRVDLLIHACALLSGQFQPRLWIVGDGPASASLRSLAQKIYPSTNFFGELHGNALNPIFEQADLFTLPGTGGLAVQQAMSFGLPVIVAEADGTQSNLVKQENGWIVPPGDLDSLVKTIENALQKPEQLRKMGLASYNIVDQEVNLENMVSTFVRAVNFTLENK